MKSGGMNLQIWRQGVAAHGAYLRAPSVRDKWSSTRSRSLAVLITTLTLTACGGGQTATPDAQADAADIPDAPVFESSLPLILTADLDGSQDGPAVLHARDGSVYVAWSSDDDIVICFTVDGVHWSHPSVVTSDPAADRQPTLYQDENGILHVAWSRAGRIMYARAMVPDTIDQWMPEISATNDASAADSVPTLTEDLAGDLVISFSRATCAAPDNCYRIYLARSTNGGDTWNPPQQIVTASVGVEDYSPAIAKVGTELVVAWNRYDAGTSAPWESTGQILTIRSGSNGQWGAQTELTASMSSGVYIFPTLHTDLAGQWYVAYGVRTAGVNHVKDIPLATPTAVRLPPLPSDWPRIVATPTPNVFIGAYVTGIGGDREIVVRVFEMD